LFVTHARHFFVFRCFVEVLGIAQTSQTRHDLVHHLVKLGIEMGHFNPSQLHMDVRVSASTTTKIPHWLKSK